MNELKLSIEVISRELKPYVAFTNFSSTREAVIDHFEVYEENTFLLRNDCLYLCLSEAFPPCKHIQEGTSIICADARTACKNQDCRRCNIIALSGLGAGSIINRVTSIISKYSKFGRAIESIQDDSDTSLQLAMNVGEEMVGTPLCLLDAYSNVIAYSDHKKLFGNPMWETIVGNNKPARCEIIDACTQEIAPDETGPHNSAIKATSISGYNLLMRNLFCRGHAVASLWALSTEKDVFFPPASLHMLAWIGRCFDNWAEKTDRLIGGRGNKKERFLLDVIEGELNDDAIIEIAANRVGFEYHADAEYQLCLFRAVDKRTAIDADITLIQEIEASFPGSICVVSDIGIIALFTLAQNGIELSESGQTRLRKLCEHHAYTGVLSMSFFNLADTSKIVRQITDCIGLLGKGSTAGKLYLGCDHIVMQVMCFVLANQPPETLIHPMIRKLQRYDQENGVDYLETLKIYLTNRCNAAETSGQLHMHRNTLLHRIKRIEEIIGQPLNDWTLRRSLLFSLDYLHLEESGVL